MAQLDVPKFIRRLRAGGISEDVAMTHAEAVTELINDGFATRADLHSFTNDLLTEINHVRDALRAEMKAMEDRLRAEITGVRNDVKALEDRLTAKFEKEILSLENRLLLKFGGMLATGIGLLAVFQALVK